jgi:homoserine dehydrogenase
MNEHQQLTIGLFGFGVVGEGLYKVLNQTPSLNATIKKVCIKNSQKKRDAPKSLFTTDKNELLDDAEINVIVEVINESEAAFEIVGTALKNKKAVVSASKKMIADHLQEILQLQKETEMPFLYEAAAGASIPIIRNLEEYYDNDLLHSMRAIANGSTNFILTKMFEENLDYGQALLLAKQLGFAETDPTLDTDGHDAKNKWSFLLTHAYGIISDEFVFTGIQNINQADAITAKEKGFEIKLVAQAKKLSDGKVAAFVLPQLVKHDDPLSFVKNEYNGVVIESAFADKQFFYGKGAGSFPTASAILSDLSALRYQYKYEYKKLYHHTPHELTNDFCVSVFVSFNEHDDVPKGDFIMIGEWHAGEKRKYLIGILPFAELLQNDSWKDNGVSLILMPDGIIERKEITKMKMTAIDEMQMMAL